MSWYETHRFLNDYILKNNCKRIMEIGVLNGENARAIVKTAIRNSSPEEVEYYGFDFFINYSSREVSRKLNETGCKFQLFEGDSVDTLPKALAILPKMDLIFIDGGKSYRDAKSDWDNSRTLMHDGTAIFVHNYYFSGVRRMVDGIPKGEYEVKIIQAPSDSDTAFIKKRV